MRSRPGRPSVIIALPGSGRRERSSSFPVAGAYVMIAGPDRGTLRPAGHAVTDAEALSRRPARAPHQARLNRTVAPKAGSHQPLRTELERQRSGPSHAGDEAVAHSDAWSRPHRPRLRPCSFRNQSGPPPDAGARPTAAPPRPGRASWRRPPPRHYGSHGVKRLTDHLQPSPSPRASASSPAATPPGSITSARQYFSAPSARSSADGVDSRTTHPDRRRASRLQRQLAASSNTSRKCARARV